MLFELTAECAVKSRSLINNFVRKQQFHIVKKLLYLCGADFLASAKFTKRATDQVWK